MKKKRGEGFIKKRKLTRIHRNKSTEQTFTIIYELVNNDYKLFKQYKTTKKLYPVFVVIFVCSYKHTKNVK